MTEEPRRLSEARVNARALERRSAEIKDAVDELVADLDGAAENPEDIDVDNAAIMLATIERAAELAGIQLDLLRTCIQEIDG